ncbi:MAG: ice-binding family protein [Betaproteobacteria bacterium]
MNRFGCIFKPPMWFVAILLAVFVVGCGKGGGNDAAKGATKAAGTGVGGAGRGPAPVDLQTAANFVILAQSAITDVPTSLVTGDVGLSPATGAGIGLACTEVTGVAYSTDAVGPAPCSVTNAARLTIAVADAVAAFDDAAARAPDTTELQAGNIGGLNLSPATYQWSSAVQIPTDLTLTGGPNDVWIFQILEELHVSSGVKIILAGGALPQNIFWQTFAADLGSTSNFKGVLLSQTAIVMQAGASIDGRLMSGTAVSLDRNRVTP